MKIEENKMDDEPVPREQIIPSNPSYVGEKVTLTAYPAHDPFRNDGEEYAYYCREFTIPKEYAIKLMNISDCDQTLEEFMNSYTWDSTDGWIEKAQNDGMLIELIEVKW